MYYICIAYCIRLSLIAYIYIAYWTQNWVGTGEQEEARRGQSEATSRDGDQDGADGKDAGGGSKEETRGRAQQKHSKI